MKKEKKEPQPETETEYKHPADNKMKKATNFKD